MRQSKVRTLAAFAALLALAVLGAGEAAGQEGMIRGEVRDQSSLAPLENVQILAAGTGIGTLSGSDGTFQLDGVPAGEVTVRAELLGYGSGEAQVTVVAGEVAEVEFELAQTALALDEVVAIGQAGQARRREVGSSIAQMNLAASNEALASVDDALSGQAPGILSYQTTGNLGGGSQIRLRGNVSVGMSNQPLVYVDGVRIRSDDFALNHAVGQHRAFGAGETRGPLADINPSDIERIEVVRGPAATAVYGTEASGGVIQIFTRRGQEGTPQWSLQVDQGASWMQEFGPPNEPFMRMDPWLGTGHAQRYSAAVEGGGSGLTYRLSASFDQNSGVLPMDSEEKLLLRGSLQAELLPDLDVQVTASLTDQALQNTTMGNNPYSMALNAFRAAPGRAQNYIGSDDVDDITALLDHEITTDVMRVVTGATATYAPTSSLTNRLTIGYDRIHQDMTNIRPFGYIGHPGGAMSFGSWTFETLSVDYVGTFDWDLTGSIRNSFSWGAQSTTEQEVDVGGSAEGLPGPGRHTVSSGGSILAQEDRQRVVNAGFFFQNLFDVADRYFLTLALRVDGNSAFGSGFGLQPYPRATFSYVVSDEDFWPDFFNETKLRVAYGEAGRAPGAFDALRTWDPVPWRGQTSFTPRNVGNPDLGPERTTELETGFDASFFDQRVTVDFTYYNQSTTDALIPMTQSPSLGFGGNQLENVGEISNRGIELDLDVTAYERAETRWEVGLGVSTTRSRVEDLGGVAPFSSSGGWIEEGYPVPAIRTDRVTNPDQLAEPEFDEDHIWGPNHPTHTIMTRTTLNLPRGVSISARGEYMGGHYIVDGANSGGLSRGATSPFCDDIYGPLVEQGQRDQFTALERSWCDPGTTLQTPVYPADFYRLRNVTLSTPLPFDIPGASTARLSLSGQNLWTWKNDDFLAMDPEMSTTRGTGDRLAFRISEQIPAPAQFRASLRITF